MQGGVCKPPTVRAAFAPVLPAGDGLQGVAALALEQRLSGMKILQQVSSRKVKPLPSPAPCQGFLGAQLEAAQGSNLTRVRRAAASCTHSTASHQATVHKTELTGITQALSPWVFQVNSWQG